MGCNAYDRTDATSGPFPSRTRGGVKTAALTGSTHRSIYTPVLWRIVQ